uniref:centrosomal protein of 152 kDa isoform X3 n=1 Tax=Myxine glutinosa TaxID=7769 RepID=UPI00359018DB
MSEDFWGLQLQEDDDNADRQEEIERENELRKLLSTALPDLEESEELSSDNVSQASEANDAEYGAHGYMEGGGFRDKKGYSEEHFEIYSDNILQGEEEQASGKNKHNWGVAQGVQRNYFDNVGYGHNEEDIAASSRFANEPWSLGPHQNIQDGFTSSAVYKGPAQENEIDGFINTGNPQRQSTDDISHQDQKFESDTGYPQEAQTLNGENVLRNPPQNIPLNPSRAIISSWQIDAGASHDCGDLQREFLNPHIGNEGLQMAQLRILYEARGRESARLTEQLRVLRDESERQTRVLNHQLALVSGEKQGLVVSLEECQKMLQAQEDKGAQLEGQICAFEAHNKALVISKNEVIGKLKVAEAAVESLQQQLLHLESSESLARSREHYESRMNFLKEERVQTEAKLLEELQQHKDRVLAQEEAATRLRMQLEQAERQVVAACLDKAAVVNQLTRSLEESQQQCQKLLTAGSAQEMGKLHLALQQAVAAKNLSESTNVALQEEISDFKEQLNAYETAAKLGVRFGEVKTKQFPSSDSYVDLAIQRLNDAPEQKTTGTSSQGSIEELLCSLQEELRRALSANRDKRAQTARLNRDVQSAESQAKEASLYKDKAYLEAQEWKGRCQILEKQLEGLGNLSKGDNLLHRELKKVEQNNQALHEELKETSQRLQEFATNEEHLMDTNRQLQLQIQEMVADFDKDKQEALERCERTYQGFHEAGKEKLREELHVEVAYLQEQCEKKLDFFRQELRKCEQELDDVRQSYIMICKEKDNLEQQLDTATKQLQEKRREISPKRQARLHEEVTACKKTPTQVQEMREMKKELVALRKTLETEKTKQHNQYAKTQEKSEDILRGSSQPTDITKHADNSDAERMHKVEDERDEARKHLENMHRELQNADQHYRHQFRQLKTQWKAEQELALQKLQKEKVELEERLCRAEEEHANRVTQNQEEREKLKLQYLHAAQAISDEVMKHIRESRGRVVRAMRQDMQEIVLSVIAHYRSLLDGYYVVAFQSHRVTDCQQIPSHSDSSTVSTNCGTNNCSRAAELRTEWVPIFSREQVAVLAKHNNLAEEQHGDGPGRKVAERGKGVLSQMEGALPTCPGEKQSVRSLSFQFEHPADSKWRQPVVSETQTPLFGSPIVEPAVE